MADYGRDGRDERGDTDERRHRMRHRDHGPDHGQHGGHGDGRSVFVSGWSGFGPDPRETRGYREGGEDRGAQGRRHEGDWTMDRSEGGDRFRRDRSFGRDDRHEGLPIEETSRLIASNKVEGTPVYSRDRHRLGTIYNFMVDKVSGQVEYAVLRYGGFLGMRQRYYPLPWRVLTYHRDAGGYVIDMMARDFEDAPSFDRNDEPEFDTSYGRRVNSWYGLE